MSLHGIDVAQEDSGAVIWLTGLSGAGKSTIADWLGNELRARGHKKVECVDGDGVRALFPATGFTKVDRDAHVRRIGYLASRLEHYGVIVIASFVSPYRESRDFVRGLCQHFIEVHVATELDVCERRDVKGLYAKARRGEITSFTGIDDPYEAPLAPEIQLDTNQLSIEEAGRLVLAYLERVAPTRTTRN